MQDSKNLGLIGADFVLVCDRDFSVLKKGGVLFQKEGRECKILVVKDYETLKKEYHKKLFFNQYYKNSALTPALANLHTHIEFSANRGLLTYGDFGKWLDSVLVHREELMQEELLQKCTQESLQTIYKSGVGTIGAISSNGLDLKILSKSPLCVVFFNEVMGSNPQMAEVCYKMFLERYNESLKYTSQRFIPAAAIHAPYSVSQELLEQVLDFAREKNLLLSTHFLESSQEYEWLCNQSGYFVDFFLKFFKTHTKPFYTPSSFLKHFEGLRTFFVHCLFAKEEHLEQIAQQGGVILSAPRSNRLLCGRYLDLERVHKAGLSPLFTTDGLSSNDSLSLLEELRLALYAYPHLELESFAKEIFLSVTHDAQKAIGRKAGVLREGYIADLAIFPLMEQTNAAQIATNLVLYAKEATSLLLNGEVVF